MAGPVTLSDYSHVSDKEWNEIPFIRDIQQTVQFNTFVSAMHRVDGRLSRVKCAAELMLGVMSSRGGEDTLSIVLKDFNEYGKSACAYLIFTKFNWSCSAQDHSFWVKVHGACP